MNNQYIAVIDSGIGGISVLRELIKSFPCEKFLYFGDNKNTPYGNKSKRDLLNLAIHNINILKSYPIKAIVLACNTLSVNLLNEIREMSGVETFGVFPPVEKCYISGNKTLLLATRSTCLNYKQTDQVKIVGFYDLAKKVEDNIFNKNKINFLSCCYDADFNLSSIKRGEFFNLIIGCTHYNFLKNEIIDHFQPQNILDGTQNLILKLKEKIKSAKTLDISLKNQVLFIGENAELNKKVYIYCGQSSQKNTNFIQKN